MALAAAVEENRASFCSIRGRLVMTGTIFFKSFFLEDILNLVLSSFEQGEVEHF